MPGLLWAGILLVGGFVVLVAGGEVLIRGASQLAGSMSIPPLVIGLTVVAFGTSAPEMAVTLQSAYFGNTDLAVGNVVGSNIFNVLFILGLAALFKPLVVSSRIVQRDVPLMIVAALLLALLGADGGIGRTDGVVLFAGLCMFIFWSIRGSRLERHDVKNEFAREFSAPPFRPRVIAMQIMTIAVGLVLLAVGSRWLVGGAVSIAQRLGISQLVIGLTIVAVGTSLPEVVTSVLATLRGQTDIAVGNVIGSNIFNVLAVLGLPAIFAAGGIHVPPTAIRFDIPVMIAVCVACLPIFFTGHLIARWEGALFLFYYAVYTTYLIVDVSDPTFRRALSDVMLIFVVPLTVIALAVSVYRSMTRSRPTSPSPDG